MIENNEYLIDKLNRIGKLKNIDNYYLFHPIDINETIKIQMPAESFTSGLYFLSIIIDDNRSLIKLIKNN